MAEETNVPKKRGRKPRDPNAPPAPKRAPKGRKYGVVEAAKYDEFIAGLSFQESIGDAQAQADTLATAADESEPGVAHSFVIFEEVGKLETEVVKKVNRNFASSRTLIRNSATPATDQSESQTNPAATTSTSPIEPSAHSGGRTKRSRE